MTDFEKYLMSKIDVYRYNQICQSSTTEELNLIETELLHVDFLIREIQNNFTWNSGKCIIVSLNFHMVI